MITMMVTVMMLEKALLTIVHHVQLVKHVQYLDYLHLMYHVMLVIIAQKEVHSQELSNHY